MYLKITAVAVAALTVGACTSPEDFESDPVTVETSQGPVTCQLYTRTSTTWDRAIDRPDAMSVSTADRICKNEGNRQ